MWNDSQNVGLVPHKMQVFYKSWEWLKSKVFIEVNLLDDVLKDKRCELNVQKSFKTVIYAFKPQHTCAPHKMMVFKSNENLSCSVK